MESCASVFTIKSNMRGVPAAAPNFSMKSSSSSLSFKPISKKLEKPEQVGKNIPFESIKAAFATLVNAFVNSAFEFGENQMILQGNFAPVDEIGEAVVISNIEGQIPMNFPEGVAPQTGELIIMGSDVKKPYYVLGVISADGRKLIHKADLKFERPVLIHDLGVVVRGCRTTGSFIPGPSYKTDEYEWYQRAYQYTSIESEGFDPSVDGVIFPRPYEWRLNLKTQQATEAFLTGTEYAMDFPTMNTNFLGSKNKYAYTQVLDSAVSSKSGMPNFKMFAKLSFDENEKGNGQFVKEEYHRLEEGTFCSGLQFVGKPGGVDEDDGWLVCYVHDERRNVSQVYIVDAKKFSEEAVAKITLPQRVPCGFHATFISKDCIS
ncbi:hypothetical protein Scep_003385 [Stephania cephalantha]|uniref:Uncharacterized protein n=1 Tax=Stephania cephalantha TaxID=152367 RepID=A0AAP0KQJ4_9MAGN